MSGQATARAAELRRLHRLIPVRRYRSLIGHWLVRWFRAPRPAAVEPVPAIAPGELALTFGGHATVIARYHDLAIAFDPMLGRWVGGVRRAVEPGVGPADLGDVGLVLISHRHADHLHLPTLRRLPRGATLVVPAANGGAQANLGRLPIMYAPPIPLRGTPRTLTHTVKGGETLASIARKYQVSMEDLRRWNSIGRLQAGQKLTIQAPSGAAAPAKTRAASKGAKGKSRATTAHKKRKK